MRCAAPRLIALLGLAGCGARSALPSGAAPSPSPPAAVACPAAVEKGSPAPMLGYCSTRDYRALVDAPSSPHVTWTASIGKGDFIPTMAVDAQGRAYVAQESPADPTVLQIQRVDPPGTVAWSTTFDGSQAGTPIVGADGDVRIVHFTNASQPEMIVVDQSGATVAKIALPNDSVTVSPLDTFDPAVGKDGSFYLLLDQGAGGSGRVAKVGADGTAVWRSAPYASSALGIALGAGDQPVVLVDPVTSPETGVVLALDPADGTTRWTRTLPGQPTAGPAIRFDGAVVVRDERRAGPGGAVGALAGRWIHRVEREHGHGRRHLAGARRRRYRRDRRRPGGGSHPVDGRRARRRREPPVAADARRRSLLQRRARRVGAR